MSSLFTAIFAVNKAPPPPRTISRWLSFPRRVAASCPPGESKQNEVRYLDIPTSAPLHGRRATASSPSRDRLPEGAQGCRYGWNDAHHRRTLWRKGLDSTLMF